MENIDFDELVVFAWEWAESFNTHLIRNAYREGTDPESSRSHLMGLRPETVEQIGVFVAQHIQQHENPTIVQKSYQMHLKALQGYTELPFMPQHYTNCEQVKRFRSPSVMSVGPALTWDTERFFKGLENDINEMVRRHIYIHQELSTSVSQTSKLKM